MSFKNISLKIHVCKTEGPLIFFKDWRSFKGFLQKIRVLGLKVLWKILQKSSFVGLNVR